jgi:uncharacterized lipoprotein YmbA
MLHKIILISLLFVLSACTPKRHTSFYLLKSIEPVAAISQGIKVENLATHKTTLLIKPIQFPNYLDRPQMVLRENDYKFKLSEYHRWAEPLKDDFTRVFIENINSRLPSLHTVRYVDLNESNPIQQLFIEVLQMDISTDNQATLIVKWKVLSEDPPRLIENQVNKYHLSIDNNSYESGVAAQSQLIALFADQVAEFIRGAETTAPPPQ